MPTPRTFRLVTTTESTETRILDAARTVFVRHGTAAARMQQIADEADVNKALLHYYFDDKATLAREVFVRAARELLPSVFRVLGSDLPIEEKVERVVALELDRLSETPFLPGYVLTELHSQPGRAHGLLAAVMGEPADALAAPVLESLERQLREGEREGTLRYVDPEQFIVNLISLCIFPFAARPMLTELLGMSDERFHAFIRERKRILPELFLRGLLP